MKSEIVEAFSQIVREKNIDRDLLSSIIKQIIESMIKKKYGSADNFSIFVSLEKGEIEITHVKTIVEEVTDAVTEIDLESARKVEPDLEVGDEFLEIIDPASFGRRLIISAKQNLNQRLKEAEKDVIFEEYKNRVGEFIVGDIRQVNRFEVFLNIDGVELVLPKSEQIYNEKYRRGEHIRVLIKEVNRTSKGPQIIVSRADPNFIVRLFEIEVPEIAEGTIEIKALAREAGDRTKIAVYSNDKRIDAVGACVGMKGVRIQSVVKELNDEKIDIINWSSEPEIFITRSLSPAKPLKIILNHDEKKAIAIIPNDQISLAIGRGGQNKRLASKLTGWEIDTIKESEYQELMEEDSFASIDISEMEDELGASLVKKLIASGYESIGDILDAGEEEILQISGVGQKTVDKIFNAIEKVKQEEYEEE
ncbi:hypothetical protein B6D60_04145 [candidate division KSB1 bacterium 4484_87]|nr:MAG: hypothetical protein B6D60_04145 [candidate division KSB1 bacterium 4484_87]